MGVHDSASLVNEDHVRRLLRHHSESGLALTQRLFRQPTVSGAWGDGGNELRSPIRRPMPLARQSDRNPLSITAHNQAISVPRGAVRRCPGYFSLEQLSQGA